MANLTHLFKVGQNVHCNMDGTFYKGTVKEIYEDHIIIDIPKICDHCYFEKGFNMDCVYPEYNIKEQEMNEIVEKVAVSLLFLNEEALDMGDSPTEFLENFFDLREINLEDINENELENMKKDVMISLINENNTSIEGFVEFVIERESILKFRLLHEKEPLIIDALNAVNEFFKDSDLICEEIKKNLAFMKKRFSKINTKVCRSAYSVGWELISLLNENFFRSNDVYTMGHILDDDEEERSLGEYVLHPCLKTNHDYGYSIAFNQEEKKIVAHVYKRGKNLRLLTVFEVDVDNIKDTAETIAKFLNEQNS